VLSGPGPRVVRQRPAASGQPAIVCLTSFAASGWRMTRMSEPAIISATAVSASQRMPRLRWLPHCGASACVIFASLARQASLPRFETDGAWSIVSFCLSAASLMRSWIEKEYSRP